MASISEIRAKIKGSFNQLVQEDPSISNVDPLNEILTFMNSNYERLGMNENIKEIDKSFIFGESDIVPINQQRSESSMFLGNHSLGLPTPGVLFSNPFIETNKAGGSIFDIKPSNNQSSLFSSNNLFGQPQNQQGLFGGQPLGSQSNNLFGQSSNQSLPFTTLPLGSQSSGLFGQKSEVKESLFPQQIDTSKSSGLFSTSQQPIQSHQNPFKVQDENSKLVSSLQSASLIHPSISKPIEESKQSLTNSSESLFGLPKTPFNSKPLNLPQQTGDLSVLPSYSNPFSNNSNLFGSPSDDIELQKVLFSQFENNNQKKTNVDREEFIYPPATPPDEDDQNEFYQNEYEYEQEDEEDNNNVDSDIEKEY